MLYSAARRVPGALLWVALLGGCGGFAEVADAGLRDGPRTDGSDAAGSDAAAGDGVSPRDGQAGKLAVGACCGKKEDCASGLCFYLGSGPSFCSATCTKTPDSCPVGFLCGLASYCVPPSEPYQCGGFIAAAKPQGLSGCCGKSEDCLSGRCLALGGGPYFCTETCTKTPDSCPVKYFCGASLECVHSGTYTCSYK